MSNAKGILICAIIVGVALFGFHTLNKDEPTEEDYQRYQQERAEEEIDKWDNPIDYALSINSEAIYWEDASEYIGEYATVFGIVEAVDTDGDTTYVDIGDSYPAPRVTGVIWSEYQSEFPNIESCEGELVFIEGELYEYDGNPNIKLTDESQIWVVE